MTTKSIQINLAKKMLKSAGYPVIYEPTDTYEMTPLRKKYTGLPMNIWIDELQEYTKSCKLTELELEALKNFVINNSEAIKKIADCILFLSDIEKHFIKGPKKANKKRIEKLNSIIQENIVK